MDDTIYINGRFLTQELTGVQRVASEIGLFLQNHYGEKVVFLCPKQDIKNNYPKQLNCQKIGQLKGHLWEQIDLPVYLYKKKASVLINFCNTAPVLFNKNMIVIHDMAIKQKKSWFDWKFVSFYNFLFFFNTRFAEKIITISEFSKQEILKYYPKSDRSKIEIIYSAGFVKPNQESVVKKDFYLAIGSLNKRKNIGVIVDAFEKHNKDNYKLKIVGGINTKVFEGLDFKQSPNVEYLGNVSDDVLVSLILEAKAVINASLYEGFGLPPLEAMSLKTPCILSDIPVYEELYKGTALFFDPLNPMEIIEKITELNDSRKYEDVSRRSYELSQRFSWDKTATEYARCIDEIVKG